MTTPPDYPEFARDLALLAGIRTLLARPETSWLKERARDGLLTADERTHLEQLGEIAALGLKATGAVLDADASARGRLARLIRRVKRWRT